MGIRGFQTFIEQKLLLLNPIELHNCNVLLDGNSIYHQMYTECHLTCLFGGEYEKFYVYCKQLFESFRRCQINVIVVFDGARLDERKLTTTLERTKKRIDYSTKISVNLDLSPLLLRQTFLHVLKDLGISSICSLGEGDEECVSLANHLDCYLIARDSDYYCYNLFQGYIPFDYLDVNPVEKDSYCYLSAQLFTLDSLLNRFPGLNPKTLALACSLCGNDYVKGELIQPIFDHIMATVGKNEKSKSKKTNRTTHWYMMQWLRRFDDLDEAFVQIMEIVNRRPEKKKIELKLRMAVESYINPSDTLIYRFRSPKTNRNLQLDEHFRQLADKYFQSLDLTDEQIHREIDTSLGKVRSKCENVLPKNLLNDLTDLYGLEPFIEILVHRRLICSAHVELEDEPSIYINAIPILLPCFALLLHWDGEGEQSPSITIHHRVLKQLKACVFPLDFDDEHFVNVEQFENLSIDDRQQRILRCLNIRFTTSELFKDVHSDFHLWLLIVHFWYSIRQLTPVYLYALILTLIKSFCWNNDDDEENFTSEQFSPFSLSIDDQRNSSQIEPKLRHVLKEKFKKLTKNVYQMKKFDVSIIHEFNCLQTIYLNVTRLNDFFRRPFIHRIEPKYFLCGSFFYAFVDHYETKGNLIDALDDLLHHNQRVLTIVEKFFNLITVDDMERLTINGHSNCLEEIFDFANDQVDEILCQVFQSVQPTSSTTPIRCRNDRRERNLLFHHTMPRCSLPTGKTTLLTDQPNYCRSFQNFNHLRYSDSIQYSFSLNRSCLTKIDQQRHQLISIQNFVNELIEHSIRTALLQIDFQQLTNENLDENDRQMSCLLFDCSPTINSVENYVDEFVQSIILQSIEDLTTNDENSTERYASRLSETILTDVLTRVEEIQQISQTLLTDDEKQRREIQRKSLGTKRVTSKDSSSSLFQQIRHRSTSALRSLIKTSSTPPDTLDSIVSSIAQQIHGDSREELRRIFIEQNPEF